MFPRRGADLSTRRVRPEIRVTSVQFSPTASAFAAASTEGLLIYSADQVELFDPFDLDVDVTPESTLECLKDKEYLNALVMSFRLNEEYLINKVYEEIPLSEIPLVAANIPVVYLSRILKFIGSFAMESQHIEFNLLWIKQLLLSHGAYIQDNKHSFASTIRSVQRFIGRIAKDVVSASTENKYSYKFLTSTDGVVLDDEDREDSSAAQRKAFDNESGLQEEDMMSEKEDEDEDEGWVGYTGKKNKLPLNTDENDDSSEDELL